MDFKVMITNISIYTYIHHQLQPPTLRVKLYIHLNNGIKWVSLKKVIN